MIQDQLKTKFPSLEPRVRDVVVNKSKKTVECTVAVCTSGGEPVDQATFNAVFSEIRAIVPPAYQCRVSVVPDFPTELEFKKYVYEILRKNHPIIAGLDREKIVVSIASDKIALTLLVGKSQKQMLDELDFETDLATELGAFTSFEISVEVKTDENAQVYGVAEQEKLLQLAVSRETLKPERYFQVNSVIACIGKVVRSRPMYISDVRGPMSLCTICGTVADKTFAPSKKDANLRILKFELSDPSGATISCIMFVRLRITDIEKLVQLNGEAVDDAVKTSDKNKAYNDRVLKKVMRIVNGDKVIVRGKIVKSEYSGKPEMQLYDVCLCDFSEMSHQPAFKKPVPSSYAVLKPQKTVEYEQLSFAESSSEVSALADKKYVVLEVNATSYSKINGRIFAVSAQKIHGGKVIETLFAYVNPELALSAEQLATVKADHDVFSFSHTLTEVIADVYKFCYGNVLVGDNAGKVKDMLNYFALPQGYEFVNSVVTAESVFSSLFDNVTVGKRPNCQNLAEVAKTCGIAHEDLAFCKEKCRVTVQAMLHLGALIAK